MSKVLWFRCPVCENLKELQLSPELQYDGRIAKWDQVSKDIVKDVEIVLQDFGGRGQSKWEINPKTGEYEKHAQGKMEWSNVTGQHPGLQAQVRAQIRARCVKLLEFLAEG